jgi:hypothetical protein
VLDGGADTVPVAEVRVEDCVTPTVDEVMIESVEVVACDEPHMAEVFATFEVGPDDVPAGENGWPGSSELTFFAKDECQARFEGYVGESYWTSRYDLRVIVPSFSTWDVGDRAVTCLVVDPDGGMLVGSAKGS